MLWVLLAVVAVAVLGAAVAARGRVIQRDTAALGLAEGSSPATRIAAPRDAVPVRAPSPSPARQPTRPAAPTPAPAIPVAAPVVRAPAKPTVLIVDDSATIQRSLEGLFRQAGYNVACAGDGQMALAWVRSNGMPALITLDLEMPNLNGVETLQALQQLPNQAPVHAVFITGKGLRLRETSGELGAIGYFNKPYDGQALLALAARVAPLPA